MPLSKEARQRLLDTKLFKRERVNYKIFNDFLEEFHDDDIDQRTFERDIKDLKTLLANRHDDDNIRPLTYSRPLESYVYEKGYFAFEETALIDGINLGKLLKYNRNFITDMETELNKQVDALIKEYSDYEESKITWEPIAYQNKINEGQKYFTRTLNYIVQQTPVEIIHQALGKAPGEPKKYLLLLLKEMDNNFAKGWYVLAQKLDDKLSEITLNVNNFNIIALDRIVSMKAVSSKTSIYIEKGFDPKDYFNNSIKGLMRNNLNKPTKVSEERLWQEQYEENFFKGPEIVKLKIQDKSNWICNYFEKYAIHPSQKHRTDQHSFYIDLFVEVDFDLENLIYMYSKELIVLEPQNLKQKLIHRLKVALENYK